MRYGITSDELRAEFGRFGPIRKVRWQPTRFGSALTSPQIRIVENTKAPENRVTKKKQRGYAFIEFEREGDMKGMQLANLNTALATEL